MFPFYFYPPNYIFFDKILLTSKLNLQAKSNFIISTYLRLYFLVGKEDHMIRHTLLLLCGNWTSVIRGNDLYNRDNKQNWVIVRRTCLKVFAAGGNSHFFRRSVSGHNSRINDTMQQIKIDPSLCRKSESWPSGARCNLRPTWERSVGFAWKRSRVCVWSLKRAWKWEKLGSRGQHSNPISWRVCVN